MNPKKEETAARKVRRKYEETHKEQRQKASGNFQAMLPRAEYDKLCKYLKAQGLSNVNFIRMAYEALSGEKLQEEKEK